MKFHYSKIIIFIYTKKSNLLFFSILNLTTFFKFYLIDADNGISILESTFKEFKEDHLEKKIFPGFFNEINKTIDTIQEMMRKGKNLNEMTRVIQSESATIIIYYHPPSKLLFCSISDADDNTEKLKQINHKVGNRFWKKHKSDLDLYRTTSERNALLSFSADIENLTLGGKYAEVFPKLIVSYVHYNR
ncbi:MAG: hypothetical protein P8Y97_04510 [Candidatus Lokiarchaeota archaeon]